MQRWIDGLSKTLKPLSAVALICSANSASLTWPAGSASNKSAPDFRARAASEKKDAADGSSCTTAKANTKSAIASRSASCMDAGPTTRASILSKRPALRRGALGLQSSAAVRPQPQHDQKTQRALLFRE